MTGYATHHFEAASRYTVSVGYDRRLYAYDLAGSAIHARMLARQGIIPQADADAIARGLEDVRREIEDGSFPWREEHEDLHMNIEARLRELIGEPAARLHTARSRNDQVATATRLYVRDAADGAVRSLRALQGALLALAEREQGAIMPGYTHLQRAQPVPFAHHLLAYFEMFDRDAARFADARKRVNVLPLGSGALAGVPLPHRPRVDGARTRLRRPDRQLDGRGVRPRLRRRISRRRRRRDDALLPPRRGDRALVVAGIRLHPTRTPVGDGLVHNAAEAQPGLRGDCARQDGARLRQPDRPAHDAQGTAPRVQPRLARGQGGALRRRRHAGGDAGGDARNARRLRGERGAYARGGGGQRAAGDRSRRLSRRQRRAVPRGARGGERALRNRGGARRPPHGAAAGGDARPCAPSSARTRGASPPRRAPPPATFRAARRPSASARRSPRRRRGWRPPVAEARRVKIAPSILSADFARPRRGRPRDGAGGRRLHSRGRDGRALRAEPHHRPHRRGTPSAPTRASRSTST